MKAIPSKVRPSLLRQLNERQVLVAIQTQGPMSRADIARQTGISGPTVTRAVAALLDSQLLEETEARQPALGRPGKLLQLARTNVAVLGIMFGPKTCDVILAGLDGQIDPEQVLTFETPPTYDALMTTCVKRVRELMAARKTTVLGLGISVPGLLNRREGRSIVSPNLHQIDGRSLGDDLRDRLQLDVTAVQEAHALCLAEQVYGAAKNVSDFAMLDTTEGLGLGVMQGGRLLLGHSGLAGELGHMTVELDGRPCGCGNRGCLETVATDEALVALAAEKIGKRLTIDEIVAGVQAGTLVIDGELQHVLDYLSVAAAAVINIFNPSKLFIYARFLDARPELFTGLLERVKRRALAPNLADCEVIRAGGSKRLGVVAAAIHGATRGWNDLTGA